MYFLQKLRSSQVVRIKQLIIISLRDSITLSLHGCVVIRLSYFLLTYLSITLQKLLGASHGGYGGVGVVVVVQTR